MTLCYSKCAMWLVTLWNFCPEDTKLIKVSCWRYIIYLFIVPFFVVQLIKQNLNITILIVIIMHILFVCCTNIYLCNYGSFRFFGKNLVKNWKLYLLQVKIVHVYIYRFSDVSEHFRTFRNIFIWNIFGRFATFLDVTDSDVSVFGRFDLYSTRVYRICLQ